MKRIRFLLLLEQESDVHVKEHRAQPSDVKLAQLAKVGFPSVFAPQKAAPEPSVSDA